MLTRCLNVIHVLQAQSVSTKNVASDIP